jgi:hypothetical protein
MIFCGKTVYTFLYDIELKLHMNPCLGHVTRTSCPSAMSGSRRTGLRQPFLRCQVSLEDVHFPAMWCSYDTIVGVLDEK